MLPTIWHSYMKLVTKYQISAINSCREKCDEKYLGRTKGRTDRQTDGRTEVKQYTRLRWSGGIIKPNSVNKIARKSYYHNTAAMSYSSSFIFSLFVICSDYITRYIVGYSSTDNCSPITL